MILKGRSLILAEDQDRTGRVGREKRAERQNTTPTAKDALSPASPGNCPSAARRQQHLLGYCLSPCRFSLLEPGTGKILLGLGPDARRGTWSRFRLCWDSRDSALRCVGVKHWGGGGVGCGRGGLTRASPLRDLAGKAEV